MGRLKIASFTNGLQANGPLACGINRGPGTMRKPILVHGYSVAPRGANFAADVQVYVWDQHIGTELLNSGDLIADDGTVKYTSDFSTDADSWVENTNGDLTFTGVETQAGVANCLKVLADAGGDPMSIKRLATWTNATVYKVEFDYFAETGSGLAYWALGENGDALLDGYDHDSGWHPAVTINKWDHVTLYGLSDETEVQIMSTTTINGNTEDTLVGTKSVWLKNIVITPVSNIGDWTLSAKADFSWDFANNVLDADAGAGGTATYAGPLVEVSIGGIYTMSATISSFVDNDLWLTVGGITGTDLTANGVWTQSPIATAITGFVVNADGDADGDIGDLSLIAHKMSDGSNFILADAPYHTTIRSGLLDPQGLKFPKPLFCTEGFLLYLTAGGAACILDVNVFYEYM